MKTISLLALSIVATITSAAVPTAIFHGLGDSCYYGGMRDFT